LPVSSELVLDDGNPPLPEATGELAVSGTNEKGCKQRFVQVGSQVEEAVLCPGEPTSMVKVQDAIGIQFNV